MKRYEKNWGQTGEFSRNQQSSNTRRRSRSRDRERSDNRRVYVEEERKRREEYYQTHDDLGRDINQYSQHSTQNTRDMSTGGRFDQSTYVPIKVDEVKEIKVDESNSISQLQKSTESLAIPEGKETDEGEVDLFDDEAIAAALGFTSFGSTKGSAIEDNQVDPARGAVAKGVPKKVYRQYMHRASGFAHALDPQAPSKRK